MGSVLALVVIVGARLEWSEAETEAPLSGYRKLHRILVVDEPIPQVSLSRLQAEPHIR